MSLSIAYITSREKPRFSWFANSLRNQEGLQPEQIMVVDLFAELEGRKQRFRELAKANIVHVEPKPNIFQGRYRVTVENWWAKSSSINTALCLCKSKNIVFVDDRCVLLPGWLKYVHEAMASDVVFAGAYEKRTGLVVKDGVIIHSGIVTGHDGRQDIAKGQPMNCGGEWLFGCSWGAPLEWILDINGAPERCNGMGFEDVIMGLLIAKNHPIRYDPRAVMIEDRTADQLDVPIKRTAKERFPHDTEDKAHTTLRWVQTATESDNDYRIRWLRNRIHTRCKFPIPDPNKEHLDWWDKKPIKDLT